MTFEHRSGFPKAYNRSVSKADWARAVFAEDLFIHGADLNDAFDMIERRARNVGNVIMRDGDRAEGAAIYVAADPEPATTHSISLDIGRIYIEGNVMRVAAAEFEGVDLEGDVRVGVRLQRTLETHEEDEDLKGLEPGTDGYLEPAAARELEVLVWAIEDDEQDGDFYSVYLLRNGTVIDQTPPPDLTGVQNVIAGYDFDANGNYIVGAQSCLVTALGKFGSDQIFSIGEGTANISGQKRARTMALRHAVEEEPDLEEISAEPHTYTAADDDPTIVTVSRPPIADIDSVIIVKRTTETVTRGPVPGGSDDLGNSSVVEIESVDGYTIDDDFVLAGDAVSWAPGGDEPADGATYDVTYLYNDAVTPDSQTTTTVTVSGGVNGKPILVSYDSKLPRIDLLCLDSDGLPVYVKGVSRRKNLLPPIAPVNVLKLCEVYNDWLGTPVITNNGTRAYTYDDQLRYFGLLFRMAEQFARAEQRRTITEFDPTAKAGIFTDAFTDDYYRDSGEAQTAATNNGTLELAVDVVDRIRLIADPITLDYDEEIIVEQLLDTSSSKVAPYLDYTILPGGMKLEPPVDHWTEGATDFTSVITQEFTVERAGPPTTTVESTDNITGSQTIEATTLREIDVQFTLTGFGAGEDLESLTFGGVDVTPDPVPTADGNGQIVDTFTIPAGMPTGTHTVDAAGAAGSYAQALFVGSGQIDVTQMSRLITVTNTIEPVVRMAPFTPWRERNRGAGGNSGADPTAFTFALPSPRMVIGVNMKIAAVGDDTNDIRVHLATTRDGTPTQDVIGEDVIDMTDVVAGDIIEARNACPNYLPRDRYFAFKFLTVDAAHEIAIARLGDVTEDQKRVSSQPYMIGDLLSGSNNASWVVHPDADPWFQIVAATFTATTKTVDLWTGDFDDITDLVVKAAVELPTAETSVHFELERASGEIIKFQANQPVEFDERITETVTLRAVLKGTDELSPILWPNILLCTGRIRTTGTYVTRAFEIGTGVAVRALFGGQLPAGSSATVEVDAADDNWEALASIGSKVLGGGWTEYRYEKDPYSAVDGRIRITLAGDADARPRLALARAYSV